MSNKFEHTINHIQAQIDTLRFAMTVPSPTDNLRNALIGLPISDEQLNELGKTLNKDTEKFINATTRKQQLTDAVIAWYGPTLEHPTLTSVCEELKNCGSLVRADFCELFIVEMAKVIDNQ